MIHGLHHSVVTCNKQRNSIDVFLQAIEEYGDVDVFVANFRPLKATLSGLPDRVFMKILVCATTNKVVGVHMCGDDAPEIIQVCMTSSIFSLNLPFCLILNQFLNMFYVRELQLLLKQG